MLHTGEYKGLFVCCTQVNTKGYLYKGWMDTKDYCLQEHKVYSKGYNGYIRLFMHHPDTILTPHLHIQLMSQQRVTFFCLRYSMPRDR